MSIKNSIRDLSKRKNETKKTISIAIEEGDLEKLELLAKLLTRDSGNLVTRNQLISEAVNVYLNGAEDYMEGGELIEDGIVQDDYDTVIYPAHIDGFQEVFIGQRKWFYVRAKKRRIINIEYVGLYLTSPISCITHYAKVAKDGFILDEKSGKYTIIFEGEPIELTHPVPLGKANQASVRAPRYTTLDKLLKAEDYSDL